ncbi:MAG: o-succinylbenzoate--CoA ligase [bacterium]|nr:o-succinylbenzoate--CoA ligase [bacterium]
MLTFASTALPDEQFNHKTEQMAMLLAERFPERGSHVGLWGENSPDYLVALFALMRAGHVAVPLQTRLTARELADVVRSAGLQGILAARAFPQTHRDVLGDVPVHPLPPSFESPPPLNELKVLGKEEVAVILCSSGSAGQAKMIPLTLRSLLDHARAVCEHLKVTRHDTWLVCLPFYHIGGLAIAFRCLLSEASLVIAESADAGEINRILDNGDASLVSVVPTLLERMLTARQGAPYPKSLRAIIVGGGPVPAELLTRCPQAYATYGLTEAGSMVTGARPGCGDKERKTCGPPIPQTQIRILNEAGEEAKRGGAGEIVVRGAGAAQTYWGDREAAAQTFRAGWIHTGDLGRLDENGFLTVEARRTNLIVSGGENMYPAEIEAALCEHPRIVEAAVLPVDDAKWGQTPGALVVLSPGPLLQKSHIYSFLAGRLARYKFPRKIVIAEKIPRLGNGKPDLREVRKLLTEGEDAPA